MVTNFVCCLNQNMARTWNCMNAVLTCPNDFAYISILIFDISEYTQKCLFIDLILRRYSGENFVACFTQSELLLKKKKKDRNMKVIPNKVRR